MSCLNNISIVLCNTTHNGNIGSSARAMKTMGLSNLILVSPDCHVDEYAYALASNARDVIENALILDSLEEALANTTVSYALTSRKREFNHHISNPELSVKEMLIHANQNEKIAIVFGCERAGLTISQLEKCNRLITIPGNPDYLSLNLSQAVQIISYEIYKHFNGSIEHLKTPTKKATFADNQGVLLQIEHVLSSTDYYQHKNKKMVDRRLQNIINKANLNREEVDLIRGMLSCFKTRNQ